MQNKIAIKDQWHNRRGGGQGAECPETSDREISADLPGKERQGKMEYKRRKIEKGKVENWKVRKWGEGLFFFLLFTFQNHWNVFWVNQNGNFLPGKSISGQGKKSGKMTLYPLKTFLWRPCRGCSIIHCKTPERTGAWFKIYHQLPSAEMAPYVAHIFSKCIKIWDLFNFNY